MSQLFDEDYLYAEICLTWGPYGAHADVFRSMHKHSAAMTSIENYLKVRFREEVLEEGETTDDLVVRLLERLWVTTKHLSGR